MPKTLLAGAMLILLSIAPASALEVTKSIEIAAPPTTVWQTVGGFCAIDDWDPAVKRCVLTAGRKPTRTLTLSDGRTIVEEWQARDEATMRYTYTLV